MNTESTIFDGLLENTMNIGLKKNFKKAISIAGIDINDSVGLWGYPDIIKDNLEIKEDPKNKFKMVVVDELPTEDIAPATIYLLRNNVDQQDNDLTEYVYVQNGDEWMWETLGAQNTIRENDYVTEDEINSIFK